MKTYLDIDHDSGVAAFDDGPGFIRVQFSDRSVYLYTDASAGSSNIAAMRRLAAAGDGLNAYINTHAKRLYARKER
jgi:hypothetical protein